LLSAHTPSPTPYTEVNGMLLAMLTQIQAVLGQQFIGFYLYGSLSLGDFDPSSSDIDFIIVTTEKLSEEVLAQVRDMHAAIASSGHPYAHRLKGSYIPREALRRYDPNNAHHPTIGTDWPFQIGQHDSNWVIEYSIVREHGIVVWGPPPHTLIDAISSQNLREAVCHQLRHVWQSRIDDRAWLRPQNYQAFAILTLCRALYTLHHAIPVSKPQAAAWAQEVYPQWRPSIERALAWRAQHEEGDMAVQATISFLHEAFTLALHICECDS
jgi:hypothetical protein